jgi:hypothetical protein
VLFRALVLPRRAGPARVCGAVRSAVFALFAAGCRLVAAWVGRRAGAVFVLPALGVAAGGRPAGVGAGGPAAAGGRLAV